MHEKNAKELLKKFREGLCTDEEKAWLDSWYFTLNKQDNADLSEADYKEAEEAMWDALQKDMPVVRRIPVWRKIAAAVVFCLAFGGAFVLYQKKKPVAIPPVQYATIIKPGENKAILTLGDGRKLILKDAVNGEIAEQNGVIVNKSADGKIAYHVGTSENDRSEASIAYNTVETPRGGQYQVNLPDGTKVWLNAASSLSFPAKFTGDERIVTLKGEAYFEVAKNKQMPFKVDVNGTKVEVLGTHFNIMSYADEGGINTTLLEGSVKVTKGPSQKIIKPGEQAVTTANNNNIAVHNTDVEEAIAWKNGEFSFSGVSIQLIMRQISRWYDVEVAYEGKIPDNRFVGKIPRSSDLQGVIKVLELNRVHVKVKGRKIIIGN